MNRTVSACARGGTATSFVIPGVCGANAGPAARKADGLLAASRLFADDAEHEW